MTESIWIYSQVAIPYKSGYILTSEIRNLVGEKWHASQSLINQGYILTDIKINDYLDFPFASQSLINQGYILTK